MKDLADKLLSVCFPDDILTYFELSAIEEHKNRIEIRFDEKKEMIPQCLRRIPNVVLDGFCNPIELLSFPIKDKPTYLKIYRRRWKQFDINKHYSNTYQLHPSGIKTTHHFASFLKEAH